MNIDAQFNETGGIFHADMGEEREISDVEQIRAEISTSRAEDKKLYNNLYANALRGTASGETINLTDVSPNEHMLGVKLSNKNLIPYPYSETRTTINGITVTYNSDNSIVFNGTATAQFWFKLFDNIPLSAGNYYLTGTPSDYGVNKNFVYIYDSSGKAYNAYNADGVLCVLPKDTYSGRIYVSSGQVFENLVFKPQLELGSTATAYTPYISDLTSVNVTARGKNLFDLNSVELTGAELVAEGIKMTAGNSNIDIRLPVGQYTLSFKRSTSGALYVRNGKAASGYIALIGAETTSLTFNYTANVDGYLRISAYSLNLELTDIQLEEGTAATVYEPYQGQAYTPTAAGTVEDVTSISPDMTLMTDTAGITIDCEYNRDINKAFAELQQAIISSGGNI